MVGVIFACTSAAALASAEGAGEAMAARADGVSIETLMRLAERGDGEAQAELGDRLAAGRDVPQDFERAALWRERAAKQGVTRAQNALGKQYAAGLGVPKDDEKALAWLQRASDGDGPDAWFDLGIFYEQKGNEAAFREAVTWHSRAVESGHVGAHAHLGLLYYNGQGVAQDLQRAAELLRHAAAHGDARAQNNLGLMFTQGKGVELDYEKAVTLFQDAADQGLKEAHTNLAVMYENGLGVHFDEAKAVDLYRQAHLQGSLEGALVQIGFLADPRINVSFATTQDLRQLRREAALGDAIAQFQNGYLLLGESTVPADYVVAAVLLEKAANNGISTAMTNLGLLYFRGLGVPQDYVLGFMWVSRGASSGRERLIEIRDHLTGFLTASQINQAQDMARQYQRPDSSLVP